MFGLASLGLAVLPLVVVRALRPLVLIRFGELISQRIGPYIAEPETYLSERDMGMHGGRNVDVFYHGPSISNRQLKKMWNRGLLVVQSARPVGMLNHWVPGGKKHEVPWRSYQQRDIYGVLPRTRPHLKFNELEEEIAEAGLRVMGVPDEAPFVCFHARDSAYGETLMVDIGRLDYRNSNIHNYVPAVEELTRRGYYALRMGAIVKEPLATTNPMIIDYATKARTELLDLYLSANCKFFIGSAVGITYIPMAFRRPTVHTNFVPIGVLVAWQPHDLCIPKKFWLRHQSRFMTIREILQSGAGMFARSWRYEEMGIELVENNSAEITAVVMEMEGRLKGTWVTTEEDEELQRQFWSLFDPTVVNLAPQARIGAEFLRQNRELLN
jgi:putative glycosyltransferase (TIGR04372 family)